MTGNSRRVSLEQILKSKDEARRENIAKPFGEKLLIVERLSRDLAPLRAAREKREAEARSRAREGQS
jgi:hypothetical protein